MSEKKTFEQFCKDRYVDREELLELYRPSGKPDDEILRIHEFQARSVYKLYLEGKVE